MASNIKKFFSGALLLLITITTVSSQDFYGRQRAGWLAKAEQSKPVLKETIVKPVQLVDLVEDKTAFQGWKAVGQPVEPLYERSMKEQRSIVVDFGEHLTGYFGFELAAMDATPDSPVRLRFTFGEVPSEIATPFDPYPGGLGRAWLQDEVVTIMTIPEMITIPRRLSFRYVKVELIAEGHYNFKFSDIFCKAVTSASGVAKELPTEVEPAIREIDRVGLNTLKECMQTVYEDGPKRDQRLWIGDLYLEALANNYSFQQHDLTRRCFYLLAGCADEGGRLNGTLFERPQPHPQSKQFLLDYSLLYNVALKDYLVATGDRETAEDLWVVVKRQLENVMPYIKENGLLDYDRAEKEWWIFFDWREGLHREVALHGLTVFAFKETYELARMLGKENEVSELPGLIKKMTEAARKHLYNKKSGLFVGLSDSQISYASQVWMIIAGIPTQKEAQRAITALDNADNVVYPGTPYAYHYYIQALIDSGLKQKAREALVEYWGGMVSKGADTFWEAYDPTNDFLSPYNFYPMNSYCHAWSCTPVYFIRKYPEIFQN